MSRKPISFEDFSKRITDKFNGGYTCYPPYINSDTEIKVKHNICGNVFYIKPKRIFEKFKCEECFKLKRIDRYNKFIFDANLKYDNQYSYWCEEFTDCNTRITITHKKCGTIYTARALGHLNGETCALCDLEDRFNAFKTKGALIYNNEYDYIGEYLATNIYMDILHKKCGMITSVLPRLHLYENQQCDCVYFETRFQDFKDKANLLHNNEYDYSEYKGYLKHCKITHKLCGYTFYKSPLYHMHGGVCNVCYHSYNVINFETYVIKANKIHNDEFEYFEPYINSKKPIKIKHKSCGTIFYRIAANHLNRLNKSSNCPTCNDGLNSASLDEINWLDENNIFERQFIFTVNNKQYRFDGYDLNTKTDFEYNGSFWHGELRFYMEDEYNKVVNKTFGELYKKTLSRREELLLLGYNVYEKWELSGLEIFYQGKDNLTFPKISENTLFVHYTKEIR